MSRLKPGQWPAMVRVCVDAARAVWAAHAERPDEQALMVGHVTKVGRRWAYETTGDGRSRQLYATPTDAADALIAYLSGGKTAKKAA
jgi:hypothetical protein